MAAGPAVALSTVLSLYLVHRAWAGRRNLSSMTGMMVAMTGGMVVGIVIGLLISTPVSLMASLDGGLAGMMGGMMGAMLGVMAPEAIHAAAGFLGLIYGGCAYLLHRVMASECESTLISRPALAAAFLLAAFMFGLLHRVGGPHTAPQNQARRARTRWDGLTRCHHSGSEGFGLRV